MNLPSIILQIVSLYLNKLHHSIMGSGLDRTSFALVDILPLRSTCPFPEVSVTPMPPWQSNPLSLRLLGQRINWKG